jgi:small multidrug resistance family-3 protein
MKSPIVAAIVTFLVLLAAAAFEVAGDAVVRRGLRGGGLLVVALGFIMLGAYGIVVNQVPWDFSRLLGVYVAVFAVVAVLTGRLVFAETIPATTWAGLAVVVAGGLLIQFGPQFGK